MSISTFLLHLTSNNSRGALQNKHCTERHATQETGRRFTNWTAPNVGLMMMALTTTVAAHTYAFHITVLQTPMRPTR